MDDRRDGGMILGPGAGWPARSAVQKSRRRQGKSRRWGKKSLRPGRGGLHNYQKLALKALVGSRPTLAEALPADRRGWQRPGDPGGAGAGGRGGAGLRPAPHGPGSF